MYRNISEHLPSLISLSRSCCIGNCTASPAPVWIAKSKLTHAPWDLCSLDFPPHNSPLGVSSPKSFLSQQQMPKAWMDIDWYFLSHGLSHHHTFYPLCSPCSLYSFPSFIPWLSPQFLMGSSALFFLIATLSSFLFFLYSWINWS